MAENTRVPESASEAQSRLEAINPSRNGNAPAQPEAAPMPQTSAAQTQDLSISYPHAPAPNWRHTRPTQMPPSAERMAAPHQRVTVRNSSDTTPSADGLVKPQTHILLDRNAVGHELQPGQSKELDLLTSDIAYYLRERDPNRRDQFGQPKPLHPLTLNLSPEAVRRVYEEAAAEDERRTAAAESARTARERGGQPADFVQAVRDVMNAERAAQRRGS